MCVLCGKKEREEEEEWQNILISKTRANVKRVLQTKFSTQYAIDEERVKARKKWKNR
jgi:hypothetical protein